MFAVVKTWLFYLFYIQFIVVSNDSRGYEVRLREISMSTAGKVGFVQAVCGPCNSG